MARSRTSRYRWNSLDRLVGVDDDTSGSWTYGYDADGLRARKSGPAGETGFVLDRLHPSGFAQVLRGVRAGRRRKLRLDRRACDDRRGRQRVCADSRRARLGAGHDGRGGAVTDRFDYDAFGRMTQHSGAAAALHRFTGEVADPESGLTYLRARYYDPRTGTFLSRDPLAPALDDPLTFNRYQYVGRNPVNRRDPSGLETVAELSVSQTISTTIDRSRLALNFRRGLARTWDTAADVARIYGGMMALETITEYFTAGPIRAEHWFGTTGITRATLDIFAAGLGEAANGTITILATAAMAKTAFDMLGGQEAHIQVEGLGVLLASSLSEARSDFRRAADGRRRRLPRWNGLAWASRTEWLITICRSAAKMPPIPDASTLSTPNRASLAGIVLHEYSHLSVKTRDTRYSCHADAEDLQSRGSTRRPQLEHVVLIGSGGRRAAMGPMPTIGRPV